VRPAHRRRLAALIVLLFSAAVWAGEKPGESRFFQSGDGSILDFPSGERTEAYVKLLRFLVIGTARSLWSLPSTGSGQARRQVQGGRLFK